MRVRSCLYGLILLLPASAGAQWVDPSPHIVVLVPHQMGGSIELLDWGGSGEPLIFIAGLGNSAHVFDEFALRFRDRYRVLGVSRRGYGRSTVAAGGYDAHVRTTDILIALDHAGIERAFFVGHSLGGEELSLLGAEHPERVRGLIFLDSYDYGEAFASVNARLPVVSQPMLSSDSASLEANRRYRLRTQGVTPPEGELRIRTRLAENGRYLGPVPGPQNEILAAIRGSDWENIAAPVLAIVVPLDSPRQAFINYDNLDVTAKAAADSLYRVREPWARSNHARLAEQPSWRVVEIRGAHHYVFLSHPDWVERLMRDFLESLGSSGPVGTQPQVVRPTEHQCRAIFTI